ncbi:MAG: NAD(P)H-dependent oxidoreductase [Bacteroidetes bacterium]|nr:NAD(P)H-dependent oxidoreductase [Bacteroidota bacterium]MBS1758072.1 NAD(P)H-dependent oxidoreductase [Bacteroidota bacterium]
MITIISGSSRQENNTKKVALEYQRILQEKNIECSLLALDDTAIYERNAAFIEMENEILIPAERFIIIMPEYNGSYPGILKLLIDNTDIAKVWWYKKVLLTGISTGRAGNLRGMEHLTGSLLHLKMQVHYNRLPISIVDKLMDSNGRFTDTLTINAIHNQVEQFLEF